MNVFGLIICGCVVMFVYTIITWIIDIFKSK
jgi:hypothetical protein